MAVRYLTEDDVTALLDVRTTIDLLDHASRELAAGRAIAVPRRRLHNPPTVLQVLPASLDGRLGHKTYTTAPQPRGPKFWVTLFANTGEMLAIIEADKLGQLRTGAASGLATRVLARDDARTAAVIGTGWQARSQLEAICAVRDFSSVRVWGRDRARLERFCTEMSPIVGVTCTPMANAEETVRGADVVCVMTSANDPVLFGDWIAPGVHINAAGSNRANAQELDIEAVRKSDVVVVEDVEQAKMEAGDLIEAADADYFDWSRAIRLADVVADPSLGRTAADQITLFESLGIGLWDVAAASAIFDAAVAADRGTLLAMPS